MKYYTFKIAVFSILVVVLSSAQKSHAINFIEDTINAGVTSSKIHIVNDSTHDIIIDSIKVTLLKGSIFDEMYFIFENDPVGLYPEFFFYGLLTTKSDSIYFLKDFSDKQSLFNGNLRFAASAARTIGEFEISSGRRNVSSTSNHSYSTGPTYTIKMIFYANDSSLDSIVVHGSNHDYNSSKVIPSNRSRYGNNSTKNIEKNIVTLSGQKIQTNSPGCNSNGLRISVARNINNPFINFSYK